MRVSHKREAGDGVKKAGRQLLVYLPIAGACALLNIGVLIAADFVGFHYIVGCALSFFACVLFGYVLHARFTFGVARGQRSLMRYTIAMSANLPISIAAVFALHDVGGLIMLVAAPLVTIVCTAINFALSRWALASRTSCAS